MKAASRNRKRGDMHQWLGAINNEYKKSLCPSKKRKRAFSYSCPLKNPSSNGGFNFIDLGANVTTNRLVDRARSIQEGLNIIRTPPKIPTLDREPS